MQKTPSLLTTLISFFFLFQLGSAQVPTFQNQVVLQPYSISEATEGKYASKDGFYQIGVGFPFPYVGELSGFGFKEGEIKIRYFDFGLDGGDVSLDFFNRQCEALESDTLKNIPGRILSKNVASKAIPYDSMTFFGFDDGRFGVERHLMRKKRLYVVLAIVNEFLDQPIFQRVLESLTPTGDMNPEAILKNRMDRLTWRPFPPTPEMPGQPNDLVDGNLKGQVAKTVDFYTDGQGIKAGMHYVNEYDRHGFNVRQIKYDQYGLPYEIEYSGYLDGKQVTKTATINKDLTLFKAWDSEMPIDAPENRDPNLGYDNRYLYYTSKTFSGGKLRERAVISGAGVVWYKWVYEYKGSTQTVTDYIPSGALRSTRVSESFDAKGNVTSQLYYRGGITDPSPKRWVVSYEYDKTGNWIKRSTCWVPKEQTKCPANLIAHEYREITYY